MRSPGKSGRFIYGRFFALLLCIGLRTYGAEGSEAPNPGEYAPEGGHAIVYVSTDRSKVGLHLMVDGPNWHNCEFEGVLKEGIVRLPADVGSTACTIDVASKTGERTVSISRDDPRNVNACNDFCGANASFEGNYFLLPEECRLEMREQTMEKSQTAYREKDYLGALRLLTSVRSRCGRFLSQLESDQTRNYLAITLYRLGRHDECQKELSATLAGSVKDRKSLRDKLAPHDLEEYQPIAVVTWKYQQLCRRPSVK